MTNQTCFVRTFPPKRSVRTYEFDQSLLFMTESLALWLTNGNMTLWLTTESLAVSGLNAFHFKRVMFKDPICCFLLLVNQKLHTICKIEVGDHLQHTDFQPELN